MDYRRSPIQRKRNSLQKQRGALLILTVVGLALIAAGAAMTMFKPPNVQLAADSKTLDALGFARDALISYAVTRGGPAGAARPGEFPCPDMNNDGRAEAVCNTSALALGRVPWITLGIPEPKDSAGETLWYAIASSFRNSASNPAAINSDTLGNLTVRVAGSANPVMTQVVAVVFAPGPPVDAQNRNAGTAVCAATGANVERRSCASNYLEAFDGANNANGAGPFISVAGTQAAGFNDRLLYIRTSDFIPAVEQRIRGELVELLERYRRNSACLCYPWAADWALFTGQAELGRNRGRFPVLALPVAWGAGGAPLLPQWFAANNWHHVIYYSAGKGQLEAAGLLCTTCTASLTLSFTEASGTRQVSAVLMTPGTPRTAVARPSTDRSHYFEDPQNREACTALLVAAECDAYIEPTAGGVDRDRIATITSAPLTCADAAAALASLARTTTCGGPGNSVLATCKALVAQLVGCAVSCTSAAATLTKPPCYNNSNKPNTPKQCASALTQLDLCP